MRSSALAIAALLAASPLVSVSAPTSAFGTATEARAMLERVVADLKKDKAAALERMNRGADGYRDRDLYPFCIGPDGLTTAHAAKERVGEEALDLEDKAGKPFVKEMFRLAHEGRIDRVSYQWPRPNETKPAQKMSFVTKVGDQVCGVGYYR
jgi:signal transduction histidine kinase